MSRITIHDVSKAAGVSIKTVSRVLNSEPNVRSETRARVLKLVEELNYHPSLSARSLAGRSSNLIGLIYQNPSANYIMDLQKGALERCHTRGYRLLVHPCEGRDLSSVRDLAGLVLESHLDGVVLAPPLSDSREVLAELEKHRIRFVRIAPTVDHDHYSCVLMNDVAAAREMTEYLIALGHERIGFINGPSGHPVTEQRFLGYTLALRAHGLDVDPQLIDRGEFTFDSGLAAARRLLSRATRPTAVFASNDDMAAGTIMAAHEMGLSIPTSLSVAGFDDSYVSQVIWPRLTTVHQPTYELAHQAADMLFRSLGEEEPAKSVEIPYRMVCRESTGPRPAN
jgi:LacI family transcriptional regulator